MRDRSTEKRDATEVSLDEIIEPIEPITTEPRADPLDEALASERAEALRSALSELPTRMRQCLTLHLAGNKYDEIAKILQISKNNVRKQLHLGRQRLKGHLAE